MVLVICECDHKEHYMYYKSVFIYNLVSYSSIFFTAYTVVIQLRSSTGSDGFITCAKKPPEGDSYKLSY